MRRSVDGFIFKGGGKALEDYPMEESVVSFDVENFGAFLMVEFMKE